MITLLSLGMGVESTSALMRWLLDPSSRPCRLDELIVITAMTGEEYARTEYLMNTFALGPMAEHGVRYVQVARAGQSDTAGLKVLSDSRSTERMRMRGPWRLFDEYRRAGTVPQRGGVRKCSIRAKGNPIDWWVKQNLGAQPYQHAIGFNLDEETRIDKDQCYGTKSGRSALYPLVDFKWTRQDAQDYLQQVTGVTWSRSCCVGCPFAGKDDLTCRWEKEPVENVTSVVAMERAALAFNPRAYIFGGGKSTAEIARESGLAEAADRATAKIEAAPSAVYEVQRVFPELDGDPATKGVALRSTRRIGTVGTLADARRELARIAAERGASVEVDRHGNHRALLLPDIAEQGQRYPAVEHCLVTAPAEVEDKKLDAFDEGWKRATGPAAEEFAVYEVRRIRRPKAANAAKKETLRFTRRVGSLGTAEQAHRELARLAAGRGAHVEVDDHGVHRARLSPPLKSTSQAHPAVEHLLVVSSGAVVERQPAGFEGSWSVATGQAEQRGLFELEGASA